jgi:hypothetical protein
MPTLTPILGFQKPIVNGDEDQWGGFLNNDWDTADLLGAAAVVSASSSFLITAGTFPEKFYRVTTGGLTVTGTLPDPGTIPAGKLFTIIILDVGGSVNLVCVNPVVTIGTGGGTTYFLSNQGAVVRLLANGATYDVVGIV